MAVRPSPTALAHLEEGVSSLRDRVGDLRWTPPDQRHLTLVFLGEVDERRYAELGPRLARAAGRAGELVLSLSGAGTFPRRSDRARVLWVGLTGDRPALARLAAAGSAAARRSGIPVGERRFSPHLTLARAKPSGGADVTGLLPVLSAYAGPTWTATELELVRSYLGPSVRHEIVDSWRLGGPLPATSTSATANRTQAQS
ncbi:MAG: RNA 2',3'-cyclic phosphodiesterase [Mycobacteriales bacterium]